MSTYLSYDGLSTLVDNIKDEDSKASEKVKDTSSSAKAYLLGHESQNTTASAVSNSSIFMENGELNVSTLKGVDKIFHSSETSNTKVFAADGSLYDTNPTITLTISDSGFPDFPNNFSDITEEQAQILYNHNIVNFTIVQGGEIAAIYIGNKQDIDETFLAKLISLGFTNVNSQNTFIYAVYGTSEENQCDIAIRILFMLDEKKFSLYNITLEKIQITDQSKNEPYYIIGHRVNDGSLLSYAAVDSSLYMQKGELYSGGKKVLTDHQYRAIKVNGEEKIDSSTSTALDISAGSNISLDYSTDSKLVISADIPETTHDVSITGDIEAPLITIGETATSFNTTITDGAVTLAKIADAVKNGEVESGETNLVTGGTVYNAIQNQISAAVQYLGTVTSVTELTSKTKAGYGDFARATSAFDMNDSSVHIGDMIILDSSAESAYASAANWNVVHGETDSWREVKVNGTTKIASNNSQALDVSAGSNTTLSYTNNKLVINSTDQKTTESGHYTPSTKKTTYGDSDDFSNTVISAVDVDSKGHIVGATAKDIDPLIGGENVLRCSANPRFTTSNVTNSWLYGEYVVAGDDGSIYSDETYTTTKVDCPANSNREYVDAIEITGTHGVCQTVDGLYLSEYFIDFINRYNYGNDAKEITNIPITFSFYCKGMNSDAEVMYQPCIGPELNTSYIHHATTSVSTAWRKMSITGYISMDHIRENDFIGLGFVSASTSILVACPMVTFGQYDVDWKPNILDSKSDIVGVGNLLRNSKFDANENMENYYYIVDDTFNPKDLVTGICEFKKNMVMPGIESLDNDHVNSIVFATAAGKGIIYQTTNDLFSNESTHSALMNYISNANTEIPVSMSIWVYPVSADIQVALMPVVFANSGLFAPVTYTTVKGNTWTRLTRTIYIPAGVTESAGSVYLGGVYINTSDNIDVQFALPMVTLGSTPSTWFPSAYDIFHEIDNVNATAILAQHEAGEASSTAEDAKSTATAANTTANSAKTLATTANTTANTALTTANNKVSKSGDTMIGALDMNENNIDNAKDIYTTNAYVDEVYAKSNDSIVLWDVVELQVPHFLDKGADEGTASHLIQGDGYFRTVETTLTDSDNIPTSSAVKKLKVGGRNLLRGTSKMVFVDTDYQLWRTGKFRKSGIGTITTVQCVNGILPVSGCTGYVKITEPSTGSTGVGIAQDCYKYDGYGVTSFYAGDTLCLSCWVKPSAAGVQCTLQPVVDNALGTTDGVGSKVFTLSAGWQRIWYSGTKLNNSSYNSGDSIGYIYCNTPGASIQVCAPKLEFGEIPTDWTPAPEDECDMKLDNVGASGTTSYKWEPNTYTNFQYLFSHTATTLTVTASSPDTYFNNFQYLLIQQTSNTCTITLTGTNIRTKGNITSFTVTAGQSIEFCALYVNGYTYVTYTIFG